MGFTKLQDLRKMRAMNQGLNEKLAASLRKTADWLERKGRTEFMRVEIVALQSLREFVTARLEANARTKNFKLFIEGKSRRIVKGKYHDDLDRKDL